MLKRRLSLTNDIRIQKSINNKRLSAQYEDKIPKISRPIKMFSQFLIVGPNPLCTGDNPNPAIITAYPAVSNKVRLDNEVKMITSFCFPSGFEPIPSKFPQSRTLLDEFIFFLKEGPKTIYGCAVHIRARKSSFFVNDKFISYPYCLCILTEMPYFSSHFQFLSFMALMLSGRVQPILQPIENEILPPPCDGTVFAKLVLDDKFPCIATTPGVHATKIFKRALTFYYSFPPVNKKLRFPYPPVPLCQTLDLVIPYHLSKAQCYAYSSFHILFSLFKIEDIVSMYTALLLEMHVFIYGPKSLHILTMTLIGLLALMSPFKSRTLTYLPVIPNDNDFKDILDSPVPYVIGASFPHENVDLIINLERRELFFNTTMPQLPKRNEIINQINAIMKEDLPLYTIPPRYKNQAPNSDGTNEFTPHYLQFLSRISPYNFPLVYATMIQGLRFIIPPSTANKILHVFSNLLADELPEKIRSCFVTDTTDPIHPVTICNMDLFMLNIPNEEKEFYTKFTQTDNWQYFCDKEADDFAALKKSQSMEFSLIASSSDDEHGSPLVRVDSNAETTPKDQTIAENPQ